MSVYLYVGFILACLCSIGYVGLATWKGKKPELGAGIAIASSAIGAVGGIKIIVFVLSGELFALIKLMASLTSVKMKLSEEDMAFFFFGGIAVVWVSVQAMCEQVAEFFPKKPKAPTGE